MDAAGMDEATVQAVLDAVPPHTAKLATTRADGSPHVAPVWFVRDGRRLVFNTGETTLKGRNLRRDPRVAVCVDDERPPFSFVLMAGRAEIVDDPEGLLHWATVIGGRYMGADQAAAYGARNAVPGELLVVLEPERVTASFDLAL